MPKNSRKKIVKKAEKWGKNRVKKAKKDKFWKECKN